MRKTIAIFIAALLTIPTMARAHCPLCTVGAGALAVLAASLGVSTPTVGVFIGGFALAMALWFAKLIKKKYFSQQDLVVVIVIFLSTIIPLMPLIQEYRSLYVSIFGQYGTLFHNTYTINLYLVGALTGAVLLYLSPFISRKITAVRGRTIAYQGVSITLVLLVLIGVIFQILF
jgi:hypothetical protein